MKKTKDQEQTVDNQFVENNTQAGVENQSEANQAQENDNMSEGEVEESDNSEKMADAQVINWQDKYLRLSAEFDNYRKRTLKEKADLIVSGGEDVIKSLLVVLDDMDRAIAAMETATDTESVVMGIKLIQQKLDDTMKSKGLKEIEAVGLPLDTDLHEAVAKFPAGEDKQGKIIDVVQKGYTLKDKVVRYAKVVVGE
ncbi:MAG: nucleotide exchange factor GrpE [Rikenellaceae bacterium]